MAPTSDLIGRTLAHYEILAPLGEGGMGVVYKARDSRLDRLVALKVLRPEKMADADRKRRFVQEARAASALNHPNIIHVYDIGEADGIDYIVMEYVQGRTLDQLIGRKGLKLGDTLKYGVQIADALSRAHAAGIVHRDLKPGNIMVDEHGLVKVLDFGLAKLVETAPSHDDLTMTRQDATGEGVIVGTVAYMSPEQAEGKPVDSRSDVFALGSVLYEMATGHKAFAGESQMSTLAAVINQEPAPMPEEVPRDLSKIIARSLRKDPDRRFHHMADVKVALEELKEESESGTLVAARTAAPAPRPKTTMWTIGAPVALVLAAAGGYVAWQAARPVAPPPRTVQLTAYSGQESFPAFAPDGKHIAFTWNGDAEDNEDIYIKLVGSEARRRLTSDPAPDRFPVWSPDGTEIAFVRPGAGVLAVYVISESGGSERKVTDLKVVPGIGAVPAISWADAQTLVTAEVGPDGTNGLFLVPVTGGEKRPLMTTPASVARYYSPVFSPDRSIVAFTACTGERACDVYVLNVGPGFTAKGASRPLTHQGADVSGIAWMPQGDALVSSTTGRLWRTAVASGASSELDLAGVTASWPAISPDGHALAYTRSDANSDIWKIDADAVTRSPLSSTLDDSDPQFSPDGKKVVFTSTRSGHGFELLVSDADGANQVSLASARIRLGGASWSPRGDRIAYDAQGEDGHWDIYVVDSAGGQPQRLTQWPTDENVPRWSGDGQWIYFGSNQTGRYEIWRIRLDGRDAVQLTRNGGTEPFESQDGKTLYFKRGGAHGTVPVFAMPIGGGQEVQVLPAVPLLSWVLSGHDIFYLAMTGKGPRYTFELRRHALPSGDDRPINKIEAYYGQGLTVSPDGKTALWSAGMTVNRDLMLIENFR